MDQEAFNKSLFIFSRNLGQMNMGGGPILQTLRAMGPAGRAALKDFTTAGTPDQAFRRMLGILQAVPDVERRNALAAAAFGRGAPRIMPLVNEGTEL